jgi:excisionase family DNA binding protein
MKNQEQILITETEMAEQLSCCKRHLITLRQKRLIPHVRLGRLVRYNPEAVAKALEKLTIREH